MAVDSVKTPAHDTIVNEVSQKSTADPWNEIPTANDVTVDDFLTSQFDSDMFKAALQFYRLPTNWNRMFQQRTRIDKETGKPKLDKKGNRIIDLGSCRSVSRACIKDNAAVWVQVNIPFEGSAIWTSKDGKHSGPKKAQNSDIQFIRNVPLDFEYPLAPEKSHAVARKLIDYLIRIGLCEPNHPIEDTGAGNHIGLPIIQIEIPAGSPPEISTLWNCAVARVVKTHILPEFDRLCQEAGIEMDLEAFDISRILSFPGTWRPTNPKKEDAPFLKKGYLRRWLAPYINGNYPVRKESAKLAQLIRDAFVEVQEAFTKTTNEIQARIARGKESLKSNPHASPNDLPNDELVDRAMAAEDGAKFTDLWYGNTGNDWSDADLALCNLLAFWTGKDAARMDDLFRQSGLMRDKWDRNARTGEKYGEGTIRRAIEGCSNTYDPLYYQHEAEKKEQELFEIKRKSHLEKLGEQKKIEPLTSEQDIPNSDWSETPKKSRLEQVKEDLNKAIGDKNTVAVYALTDLIAMLSSQEQASISIIIDAHKKQLPGYKQSDFNNCLKESVKGTKEKKKQINQEASKKKHEERKKSQTRSEIILNRGQERDHRDQCIEALVTHNTPPSLFTQSNEICRVLQEQYKREDTDGKEREYSRSYIERHVAMSMLNKLIDICDFVNEVETEEGETKYVPASPPTRLAEITRVYDRKPYPHILGTISVPILRPSGEISTTAGYDTRSHLWYAPSDDLKSITIPEQPSKEDALQATEVIDDILHDFCFASKKDRTHTFAALLTPLLRPILGNIPLCNIDAPKQGTGKSKLCDIIVTVATLGSYANLVAPQSNPRFPNEAEEEWRKSILANLMQGHPIVIIDNLPRGSQFSCAALDSALTKPEFSGRVLGTSNMITVPSRAIWICNGNNITIVGDTARRSYHIRLDPQMSTPWLREGFRYSDIISTVREKRAAIITALLTIIRAWFVAGKPPAENAIRLGSFEEWADILGGILHFIGLEGFLSDIHEQKNENLGDEEWTPFLEGLYARHPDKEYTTSQLHAWCTETPNFDEKTSLNDLLPERYRSLASESEQKFKNALSKKLKQFKDACFGKKNIRLEVGHDSTLNAAVFKVTIPKGTNYDMNEEIKETNRVSPQQKKPENEYDAYWEILKDNKEGCTRAEWIDFLKGICACEGERANTIMYILTVKQTCVVQDAVTDRYYAKDIFDSISLEDRITHSMQATIQKVLHLPSDTRNLFVNYAFLVKDAIKNDKKINSSYGMSAPEWHYKRTSMSFLAGISTSLDSAINEMHIALNSTN